MSKIKPISPTKQVVSGVDTALRIGSGGGGGKEQASADMVACVGQQQ
jgi:H+/Cl- antiporter ClcA